MSKRTDLSAGNLNGSDRLTVELIEPTNKPPIVAITWPTKPTVCTPASYDQVAAIAMRLLSAAVIELAESGHGDDCKPEEQNPWRPKCEAVLPCRSRCGSGLIPNYCPVSRFRRARWMRRNVITMARTNNGSNMKTNKDRVSITTSCFRWAL